MGDDTWFHFPDCRCTGCVGAGVNAEEAALSRDVVDAAMAWEFRAPNIVGGVEVIGGSRDQRLERERRDACAALRAFRERGK